VAPSQRQAERCQKSGDSAEDQTQALAQPLFFLFLSVLFFFSFFLFFLFFFFYLAGCGPKKHSLPHLSDE